MKPGRNILVVGGGHFGQLALKRLRNHVAGVIEPKPTATLRALAREAGAQVVEGGVESLSQWEEKGIEWVVPTVPVHLGLKWALLKLPGWRAVGLPREVIPPAPVVIPNTTGGYYLSIATFICPEDCPQPPKLCTHTRAPRPMNLVDELGECKPQGWNVALLISHQLAPGIGGIKAQELWRLPSRVGQGGGRWVLATACACHAVVDGLAPGEN